MIQLSQDIEDQQCISNEVCFCFFFVVSDRYKHGEITDMMEIDSERLQTMTAYVSSSAFDIHQTITYDMVRTQYHLIGHDYPLFAGTSILVVISLQVGWSAFVGLGVILIMFPIARMISKHLKQYQVFFLFIILMVQRQLLREKDKRIQLTTEILTGIKTIKIQAWEESFLNKIQEIRKMELYSLKKYVNLSDACDVQICLFADSSQHNMAVYQYYCIDRYFWSVCFVCVEQGVGTLYLEVN